MNSTNYDVPHCGAFSTPHSHPSWAQIFSPGSCFQIPLAFILRLMFHNHIAPLTSLLLYINFQILREKSRRRYMSHVYYFFLFIRICSLHSRLVEISIYKEILVALLVSLLLIGILIQIYILFSLSWDDCLIKYKFRPYFFSDDILLYHVNIRIT